MTLVKICGLTTRQDAELAASAGADLLGFHFCESLRRVTPDQAARIIQALDPRPKIVGVFIDPSEDEAESIADFCGLDILQLHGSEKPGFRSRCPVMKVFKVQGGEIPPTTGWPDPIVLDSWSADQRGGTGREWGWESATSLLNARRVFIAGGLRPESVADLVTRFRPYGVDVSSGVEGEVRHKDPGKVRAFVGAVREADAQLARR